MLKFLCGAALLAGASLCAVAANATTFAQFFQIKKINTFGYQNKDRVPRGVIIPNAEIYSKPKGSKSKPIVSVQALIDGIAGSGVFAGNNYNAYLSFDANSSTAALSAGGANYTQLFDSGELTLTSVATGEIFVDAVFTDGIFSAAAGARAATFAVNDSTGSLDFSSDIFDIANTNNSLALEIAGLTKAIAFTAGHSLNYKANTSGMLTGSFSSDLPVPEPTTMAMFGLGLAAFGLRSRRSY